MISEVVAPCLDLVWTSPPTVVISAVLLPFPAWPFLKRTRPDLGINFTPQKEREKKKASPWPKDDIVFMHSGVQLQSLISVQHVRKPRDE